MYLYIHTYIIWFILIYCVCLCTYILTFIYLSYVVYISISIYLFSDTSQAMAAIESSGLRARRQAALTAKADSEFAP